MRLHVIQHVPFEDEANIALWAKAKKHPLTRSLMYKNQALPHPDYFDWLIVMGGPMSANDEKEYPWLAKEKELIHKAIVKKKTVLGICLGAQLIASAMGARVFKNHHKEIGWHPVTLTENAKYSKLFGDMPFRFTPFHWHGETFDWPDECIRLAHSEACTNQAFDYHGHVLGLQFHLEVSEINIRKLMENCPKDLEPGKYIQEPSDMLKKAERMSRLYELMNRVLDNLAKNTLLT